MENSEFDEFIEDVAMEITALSRWCDLVYAGEREGGAREFSRTIAGTEARLKKFLSKEKKQLFDDTIAKIKATFLEERGLDIGRSGTFYKVVLVSNYDNESVSEIHYNNVYYDDIKKAESVADAFNTNSDCMYYAKVFKSDYRLWKGVEDLL